MSSKNIYDKRFTLIKKAIACELVERVPVIYMGTAFSPRFTGLSIAEFCSDPEKAVQSQLETLKKIGGFDGCQTIGRPPLASLSAIWLSRVKIPGKDLPADSLWQVEEDEILTESDYRLIIEKGWKHFFQEYLPRVIDIQEYREAVDWSANNGPRIRRLYQEHGYVVLCDTDLNATIPFESLCGGRSFQKFIIDLFRMPDLVQEAMDIIMEESLEVISRTSPASSELIGCSWIGGWRSASALLSPKIWNRFVWPYIVRYVNALVDKGYTPVLHWDQDWTRDLERLKELPPKKVVLNPDGMTDVRKFREIVGDNMALLGDVPSSIFAAGTPEDIYGYVHDLVRDVGTTGLLLCPGCDAPINTRPENMQAFADSARDYGKVS